MNLLDAELYLGWTTTLLTDLLCSYSVSLSNNATLYYLNLIDLKEIERKGEKRREKERRKGEKVRKGEKKRGKEREKKKRERKERRREIKERNTVGCV